MASTSNPHHSGNPSAILFTLDVLGLVFVKDYQGKMEIPPRDLNIVWGKDNRYWNIPEQENIPVELYQVSWLEVTGSVDGARPDKTYEVGFRVSFNPDAFGWGKHPIHIMVKKGKQGKMKWTKVTIDSDRKGEFVITGKSEAQCEMQDSKDTVRLYFGLYEVWSGKWKGGLKIHHAVITELP